MFGGNPRTQPKLLETGKCHKIKLLVAKRNCTEKVEQETCPKTETRALRGACLSISSRRLTWSLPMARQNGVTSISCLNRIGISSTLASRVFFLQIESVHRHRFGSVIVRKCRAQRDEHVHNCETTSTHEATTLLESETYLANIYVCIYIHARALLRNVTWRWQNEMWNVTGTERRGRSL